MEIPALKICSLCRVPIGPGQAYHKTDMGRRYHTSNSTLDPQDPEGDSMRTSCYRWFQIYNEVDECT